MNVARLLALLPLLLAAFAAPVRAEDSAAPWTAVDPLPTGTGWIVQLPSADLTYAQNKPADRDMLVFSLSDRRLENVYFVRMRTGGVMELSVGRGGGSPRDCPPTGLETSPQSKAIATAAWEDAGVGFGMAAKIDDCWQYTFLDTVSGCRYAVDVDLRRMAVRARVHRP